MTATRKVPRRSLAFFSALAVLFALIVPLATSASASVDNSFDLQVTPETDTNATADLHVLTATMDPVCDEAPGCEIDFEVESGAAVSVTDDDGTNPRTTDADNSPTSPDMTCTVADTAATCTVEFTSPTTAGSNTVRAWVDDDKDNSTADFDASEGQDETTTPGARTEDDDTDVVTSSWFGALVANFALDCTPETQTLPSSGAGSGAAITCKAFNDNGAGGGTPDDEIQNGTEAGIAGVLIDGENNNGANDPDNGTTTPADYNNFCTTGADGTCTGTVPASESQAGDDAEVCLWADADNDNVFGGTVFDGANCFGFETPAVVDSNETDAVLITWVAPGTATTIVCSPRSAQKLIGASHTVDCHVEDPFGNPSVGALVDFDVSGKNGTAGADDSATDTNGDVSFTYTDNGAAPSPEGQEDEIEAELDNGNDDVVFSYWFTAIPTVADVVIDAELDASECEDTDALTEAEFVPTAVGGEWYFCVSALDALGAGIPGASVSVTTTGAGSLVDDENDNQSIDEGEAFVTAVELTTDADGEFFFLTYSEESGEQTLTATSGAASDTNSRDWYSSLARNITCDPAGSSPTGVNQIVNCVVSDRYGNPVDSVGFSPLVEFSESGAGRIDSADGTPDANGEVEVVTSTTSGEEGVQVISAEITDDGNGAQQDCLALANAGFDGLGTEAGTPAGNCEASSETTWTDEPAGLDHARTLSLKKLRHVKDGGKRKLLVKGSLTADDGFAGCEQAQEVKLQRKVAGSWFTQKTDTTGTGGNAKFLVRHRNGKYRLRANQTTDGTDTCGAATSNVKKHKH